MTDRSPASWPPPRQPGTGGNVDAGIVFLAIVGILVGTGIIWGWRGLGIGLMALGAGGVLIVLARIALGRRR